MHKIPVDMMFLEHALESSGGENEWYLDLETGDVLNTFDCPEDEEKVESDPDRYLRIERPIDTDDFRTMEAFVAGLPTGECRRDLERVLRRARPFHNFRAALREWPEVREQWYAVEERHEAEVVRDWLAANDIEPTPRPPPPGVPEP